LGEKSRRKAASCQALREGESADRLTEVGTPPLRENESADSLTDVDTQPMCVLGGKAEEKLKAVRY
jgi:hypothetical protein